MKRIRIVDDSSAIIELLIVMLRHSEKFDPVVTSSNFQTLLTPEPWEGIDGAVVDCYLQEPVTGFDILGYLKDHHPHIKRVAFTALNITNEEIGDLAVVIQKPGTVQQIAEAFDE